MEKDLSIILEDELIDEVSIGSQMPIVVATRCLIRAETMSFGMGVFTRCAIIVNDMTLAPYDFDKMIGSISGKDELMLHSLSRLMQDDFPGSYQKMPGVMFNNCCAIIENIGVEMTFDGVGGYLYINDQSQVMIKSRDERIVTKDNISRPRFGLVGNI